MPTKYIFVSGGVISGIGKGNVTAAIALLLQNRGFSVTCVKCENYLNIDAGLINPVEHGDPYLMEDGTESDMDMGTYEKYLGKNMHRHNFVTMGQIYKAVIDRERSFGYKGEDVEAIPHVTDEIIKRIGEAGQKEKADIVIIELGGTAGEYQNMLYYEASRILSRIKTNSVIHVHVSYLPTPIHLGEPKTKPTQLSVRTLNSMGIQPDFIVARSEKPVDDRRRERFALFCNVDPDHIINSVDLTTPYEAPLHYAQQKFDEKILTMLGLPLGRLRLGDWKQMVGKALAKKRDEITIAIVGKYFATGEYQLRDSYAALLDAISHAGWESGVKAVTKWIQAEKLEKGDLSQLEGADGIIVPIGWGPRGVEGKITAVGYARTRKVPYLGLCYGMQLAVVEYARNVLRLENAHTLECDSDTAYPVIHMVTGQDEMLKRRAYGGTMRLGRWDCKVKPGTMADEIYSSRNGFSDPGKKVVGERHRHRYEFNNKYASDFEKAGLVLAGRSVVENLVEIIELPKSEHPFFFGTQYHPEYRSRPLEPHPVFLAFIEACRKQSELVK
ncbi:CTP synthase [Candidatus Gottesmanbacteria bacterium RBG_16_52_11]|uniref:CTP synthase (glutamine hydrolyzing) n=1 Tax=Candidatus Gottesmanbacteria bacterium RBG_16_52_11 TaxID=1798374 RepID=A0A1F5YQX3_9BACT|nr:MAG: CTP synthase [Candidatus Gottesmanbacteria bacterium RBG_16_52_11]